MECRQDGNYQGHKWGRFLGRSFSWPWWLVTEDNHCKCRYYNYPYDAEHADYVTTKYDAQQDNANCPHAWYPLNILCLNYINYGFQVSMNFASSFSWRDGASSIQNCLRISLPQNEAAESSHTQDTIRPFQKQSISGHACTVFSSFLHRYPLRHKTNY